MRKTTLKRNQNIIEFLSDNQPGIMATDLWLSEEAFKSIWDTCVSNKGVLKIQTDDKFPANFSQYFFKYNFKNCRNEIKNVQVLVKNYPSSHSKYKHLRVEQVFLGDFKYENTHTILAPKLYIDKEIVKEKEL